MMIQCVSVVAWEHFSNGLTDSSIQSLLVDRWHRGVVYAGTRYSRISC